MLYSIFYILGEKCLVRKLNESFGLSPFFLITTPDGKEHIVTGLGLLLFQKTDVNVFR